MFKFLYISWCISCIHVYNINDWNHIICACVCVHNSCAISILYVGFDIPRLNVLDKSYGPISIHNCGWIADPCFALTPQCHSDALHKHDLFGGVNHQWNATFEPQNHERSTDLQSHAKKNVKRKVEAHGPCWIIHRWILHHSLPR
jgi:hypothetical protein